MANFARAEVRVSNGPAGWDEIDRASSERAQAWAKAVNGRVVQAFATRTDDGFYETLAIVDIAGALEGTALIDPEVALASSTGDLFGDTPSRTRVLDPLSEAPVMIGRYDADGMTHDVAVVSAGARRALVILAVRTSEQTLYAQVFEDALANLRGMTAPVVPFDHARWRWMVLLGGILMAVVAWLVLSRTSFGVDGSRDVGRAVGITSLLLGVLAAAIAYGSLSDAQSELALAGLDRAVLAAEVALMGVLAGGVSFALGIVRDDSVRRIESAPAGGSFATSGVSGPSKPSSTSPSSETRSSHLVPPATPAALTSPGYGMSPQDMDRADEEAVRTPVPTLRGTAAVGDTKSRVAFDEAWAKVGGAHLDDDELEDDFDEDDVQTAEADVPLPDVIDDDAQTAEADVPVPEASHDDSQGARPDTTVGPPPTPPRRPDPSRGNTTVAAVVPPPKRRKPRPR